MARAARILLVEDDPLVGATLQNLLTQRGFEIEWVETGAAAIAAFDRHPPDLILLDLGLPDEDGCEVCRWVRSRSQAPIIVVSAQRGDGDKIAALDAGADDYVTKPFSAEELLARIRAALRRTFGSEAENGNGRFQCDDLTIDFDRRRVFRALQGSPPDTQGVRAPGLLRSSPESPAVPRHHPHRHLGCASGRSTAASVGARPSASQEARSRSEPSPVSCQ